ncbi:PREDICTED: UDP-glycosyltransferase 74B1-like isoform X1 [Ipomoea nil]|uniref:UDP-glycosyltransferase 74B1-like isoform X1 n=1 Tax=Ipomoea nil TaxID=35883 RepID=UPI000901A28E|nr:PREDICTED: UDP-glycosyltransferase 74B1-like isoform X1 [Ipomoea nil]
MEAQYCGHVLLLPYPAQGHINPLLQFAKRLASKGVKATIATTTYTVQSIHAAAVTVEPISDGFDDGGFSQAQKVDVYLNSFEQNGSKTLSKVIAKYEDSACPVNCVVYDAFFPWALDVARRHGVHGAAFFTNSAAVCAVFAHIHCGSLELPVEIEENGAALVLPGIPPLYGPDIPSFITAPDSYPAYLAMKMRQFSNVGNADWIFANTYQELESEVVAGVSKVWPAKLIGPMVPSSYLDGRIEGDKGYGASLWKPLGEECLKWLKSKPNQSVVYISFGSMVSLSTKQMDEIAWALIASELNFLWVVRESERSKLPQGFVDSARGKGLVVSWCNQLEMLAHPAIGCFVTHCGWNSTLELLSLGVPTVAMPQWSDQFTDAKFIEEIWKVGVRPKLDKYGIVNREELVFCLKEVMEGEMSEEIKRNARKWRELAKGAVSEGGSSDKAINEFVEHLKCSKIGKQLKQILIE